MIVRSCLWLTFNSQLFSVYKHFRMWPLVLFELLELGSVDMFCAAISSLISISKSIEPGS